MNSVHHYNDNLQLTSPNSWISTPPIVKECVFSKLHIGICYEMVLADVDEMNLSRDFDV